MTLTIKLDGNWNNFQLANSTPPLSVTGNAIAPSARMIADAPYKARTDNFQHMNSKLAQNTTPLNVSAIAPSAACQGAS